MEWYWWVVVGVWIVSIIFNIWFLFGTTTRRDRVNRATFYSTYEGCDGRWDVFMFELMLAPVLCIINVSSLDEVKPTKDINYSAIIYLLPVLCLLGLYWV